MRVIAVLAAAAAVTGCGGGAPTAGGNSEGAAAEESPAPVQPRAVPASDEVEQIAKPSAEAEQAGACRMQDGKMLEPNALKAIGTEPFWGARIDGRCVTYSHPEDQDGMRIWTQFTGSRDAGEWTGFYQGQRFVLRTRAAPGCSDGMSDRRYPVAVTLTVAGEERIGCAFRL